SLEVDARRSLADEAESLLREGYTGLRATAASIPAAVRARRLARPARSLEWLLAHWSALGLGREREAEAEEWRRTASEWDRE
ncbi:MAG: hypothetical protein KDC38_04295, partial [Planctomycetes bacterium]|nr:hypothetical protein [Planctomycetota bacterium]